MTVVPDYQPVIKTQVTVRQPQVIHCHLRKIFNLPAQVISKVSKSPSSYRNAEVACDVESFHKFSQYPEGIAFLFPPTAAFKNCHFPSLASKNKKGITSHQ
jgi:hypothetical protein